MTTVKARMIDQSHFIILTPIPCGTKEFHVVLEEPANNALQSFQKISGLLKDLDAASIKLFDETVQHNRFFRETKQ